MPSEQLKQEALSEVVEQLAALEEYKSDMNDRIDKIFAVHLIGDPIAQKAIKFVAKKMLPEKGLKSVLREAAEVESLCRASDPQMSLFDVGENADE